MKCTSAPALLLVALLAACSDKPAPQAAEATALVRERVAAHFQKEEVIQARTALAPLVERKDAALEDLLRGAAIEIADNKVEAARAFLDRAQKIDANSAAVHYLRGQLARDAGKADEARSEFEATAKLAPGDLPTRIMLGELADDAGKPDEAIRLYKSVVDVGAGNGEIWYVAVVYRLSILLTREGHEDEAARFDAVRRKLELAKIKPPTTLQMLIGTLGKVRPPTPDGNRVEPVPGPLAFDIGPAILPEFIGATRILASDLDNDGRPELVAYGPKGLFVARSTNGAWKATTIVTDPVEIAIPYDVDNDGDCDFLVVSGTKAALFIQGKDGSFTRSALELPALPSAPSAAIAVDYDHEGDLDLVFVGQFGVRVWRHDGAIVTEKGTYTDATAGTGLPTDRPFSWIVAEDFDGDNDVDLLLGGPNGIVLADNLRDEKFVEKKGVFEFPKKGDMVGLFAVSEQAPLVADFDGDGKPDLWFPGSVIGSQGLLLLQGKAPRVTAKPAVAPGALASGDFNLDGGLDVIGSDGTTAQGILNLGLSVEREMTLTTKLPPCVALCAADFDGDMRLDLALLTADGVHIATNQGPTGNSVRIALEGVRDNRRAKGAIVELRAGGVYRRIYWRGEPEVIGIGAAKQVDMVRATWLRGDVTTLLDVPLMPKTAENKPDSAQIVLKQSSGQIGSCPFLYAWNGKTYGFITDVLGITPLGLRMEPGMFVPPDHDEYVLVKGEQIAPKDGRYELQVTEELREVTYLDHAKLLVVDHPSDTEIFPNELFCFPPFPAPHVHTIRGALQPTSATGSDGKDWRNALLAIDDVHPEPFTLKPAQFAGLCDPWFLELAFDKDAVLRAPKMRLVMTGWFFWSDASANMAASRTPDVPFIPPIFQVPDDKGGWRDAGPPVGFPAGKTKTMVIDVTDVLRRDDPRIRIFTTLRLYWDRIELAVDADDAPLVTTELACTDANVWRRGFSAPLAREINAGDADPKNRPERFDWDRISDEPRWNQHPGLYTHYGACLPLVSEVDDRFVILGAGDALKLGFDAHALPPLASGSRRDVLVYLDGWAKDRDPNTIEALNVEPLPFHAMSGYPYAASEHFPDDEAHVQWRKEWNTRPAFEWIAPMSPIRQSAWLSVP